MSELELETVDVSADDGVESRMTIAESPRLSPTAPTLLLKPAMGVRASFYRPLFQPLESLGLRLITADLRGHGESSVRPSRSLNFGFREMIELDWPAEIGVLRERHPGAPVYLFGHSLGGKLSLLHAAAFPGSVEGVITVAAASVYWRAFPGWKKAGLLAFTQLADWLARALGSYHGQRLGFGGHESRGVIRDWAFQARTGRYQPVGSQIDYMQALAQCSTPALVTSIDDDRYVPHALADHLASFMPAEHVQREAIHGIDVSNVHFRWIDRPQALLDAIMNWLRQR